ncbi:MAG: hypothetical protein P4L86_27615 [Mycobacterium sp.]|nr:hypothetical protein [Mycobacterium sp.]
MPEDEKTAEKTTKLDKAANDADAAGSLSIPQIVAIVAVVVALAAAGVAGWALYKVNNQAKTYSPAEQDAAKIALCDAMKVVSKGISINTNLAIPGGPGDTTGALAVAANARMALITGGQYLLIKITPAVPTDLADVSRKYSDTLLDIGAAATAGAQTDDQQQKVRLDDAGTYSKQINDICK